MITMEMVDELRKRTGSTYEEAKAALEANNGDLLESIIYLEKQGKMHSGKEEYEKKHYQNGFDNVVEGTKKIVKKGNNNFLVISKREERVLKLSLTVSTVLTVIAPYVVVPTLGVALLTGHRFKIEGKDLNIDKVNKTLDKISNKVDEVKKDLHK